MHGCPKEFLPQALGSAALAGSGLYPPSDEPEPENSHDATAIPIAPKTNISVLMPELLEAEGSVGDGRRGGSGVLFGGLMAGCGGGLTFRGAAWLAARSKRATRSLASSAKSSF
jgi:hypothetical protein